MKSLVANKSFSRRVRVLSASACLAFSLCAATAWAACDPNNIKHVPCPAPAQTSQPLVYHAASKPSIGPVAPGPLHAAPSVAGAGNQQSIIFVGGKPSNGKGALNPQPIPPGRGTGKTELNPQPIPPGKRARPVPKWDLTKNKSS
jgi:hypothetical protein